MMRQSFMGEPSMPFISRIFPRAGPAIMAAMFRARQVSLVSHQAAPKQRAGKQHANGRSRCTRPAQIQPPTSGIIEQQTIPQHAPFWFPAHVTPLSAGSCAMTCPNRQHGQQHPMQQPGVLKHPKSPVFHVAPDMMKDSATCQIVNARVSEVSVKKRLLIYESVFNEAVSI